MTPCDIAAASTSGDTAIGECRTSRNYKVFTILWDAGHRSVRIFKGRAALSRANQGGSRSRVLFGVSSVKGHDVMGVATPTKETFNFFHGSVGDNYIDKGWLMRALCVRGGSN